MLLLFLLSHVIYIADIFCIHCFALFLLVSSMIGDYFIDKTSVNFNQLMLFLFYLLFSSVYSMHFFLNFIPRYPHLLKNILFVMLMQHLQQNIHLASRSNNPLHGLEVLCLLVYLGFILDDQILHLNNLKYFLHFLQMLCLKYFHFFYQISSFFYHLLFIQFLYFLFFIQLVFFSLSSEFQSMILYFNYLCSSIQVIFQLVIALSIFVLQLMQIKYQYSFVNHFLIIFFNFE